MSWVRVGSKVKVIELLQHPIDEFSSMSIGQTIFVINLFQIQGQCYGWGQNSISCNESIVISILIPFVPCQSDHSSLRYVYFEI